MGFKILDVDYLTQTLVSGIATVKNNIADKLRWGVPWLLNPQGIFWSLTPNDRSLAAQGVQMSSGRVLFIRNWCHSPRGECAGESLSTRLHIPQIQTLLSQLSDSTPLELEGSYMEIIR